MARKTTNREGLRWKRDKWYGRWYDHRGIRRERALSTDREIANRRLRKILHDRDLEASGLADGERQEQRLSDVQVAYEDELQASGRRASYLRSVSESLGIVLGLLGPLKVKELDTDLVRQARRGILAKGASNRTANIRIGALISMLRWAEEQGVIARNPLPRIPPLPTSREHRKKVRRSLTAEEVQRLLTIAAEDDGEQAARVANRVPQMPTFLALVQTGLRSNEIRSLRWSDIDEAAAALVVRPETAKNKREQAVEVPRSLLEVLASLRARHAALLGAMPSREDRVFLAPGGKPWGDGTNLLQLFYRLLKKAGIDRKDDRGREVDIHSLRVTCGSLMIAAGADLRTVQVHLRHSTPTLTAAVYSDPMLVPVRRSVDALAELLGPPPSDAGDRSEPGLSA